MTVLHVDSLLQNPKLGMGIIDPTLITLLGETSKTRTLAQEFANTAKVHDPELRRSTVCAFFEKHHTKINQVFPSFIGCIDSLDELNAIPYEHMAKTLEDLNKQAEAFKAQSDDVSQKNYQILTNIIKAKINDCVKLLLISCEKINVWHTLLTHYLPHYQPAENKRSFILGKMLSDFNKATSYLVQRLLSSKLGEQDYYAVYQILNEKFQWLEELIGLYLTDLKALHQNTSTIVNNLAEPMPVIIDELLSCMQNATSFYTAFMQLEKADNVKLYHQAFCEALMPIIDDLAPSLGQQRLTAALEKLDSVSKMLAIIEKNQWFPTFIDVNHYLQTNQIREPKALYTLDEFRATARKLITDLTVATERQHPELAQEWIKQLLHLAASFQAVDGAAKTQADHQILFRVSLMLFTYLRTKEISLYSDYVSHSLMGALKKLTDKILHASKAELSVPVAPQAAPIITVASLPASSSDSSLAITEQLGKLSLEEDPMPEVVVADVIAEEVTKPIIAAEELEKERETIMAAHQAALRANQLQHEQEKQKLSNELSQLQQQELAELRQRLQQELAVEQQKLDEAKQKYIEKRTKRITVKKQEIAQTHQEQIKALREKQIREIDSLKNKEKNEFKTLQRKQTAEI